jgi:riboflavin kinase/FMN adenylyltransferase
MSKVAVVPGVASLGPTAGRLFVVVGVFDGLHRGHLYLLRALRREAALRRARPAVITFDAHPDEVILGAAPPLLLDPDERLARLARAGVEVTVVQHFDRALRETPYDAFVEMISLRTELAGFLMTPDAAFGHERRGTPEELAQLGSRSGFDVAVVPPFELDGRSVRSADIRAAISVGDLRAARALLGRGHAVTGTTAGNAELAFDMPVALPPAGRYDVAVEPGWSSHGPVGRALPRTAEVREDRTIRLDPPVREGRRRVRFGGRSNGL